MNTDPTAEPARTSATILVVDDSKTIRQIIGRTLTDTGYRVVQAENGRAALDACGAEHPDLVLLDIDMPVMDGPTTLRALRADPAFADLPVLFLTARTGGADVAAGLQLGAQDYLRKPCEPAELTARVATALRIRAREAALDREARDMRRMSTTDPLTGLGNRRRVEATIADWTRTHGPDTLTTLIMVDVDHFKSINDTYGHTVGDSVLRVLAGRLRDVAGDAVQIGRWGGEEFLVTGIGLDDAHASALAEQLRASVGATPFTVGTDLAVPVTVSAGCVIAPLTAFSAALDAVDAALYEAKRSGRNRVAVIPSPPRHTPRPT